MTTSLIWTNNAYTLNEQPSSQNDKSIFNLPSITDLKQSITSEAQDIHHKAQELSTPTPNVPSIIDLTTFNSKCPCPTHKTEIKDSFKGSDIVIVGQVSDIIYISGYQYLAQIDIIKKYKYPYLGVQPDNPAPTNIPTTQPTVSQPIFGLSNKNNIKKTPSAIPQKNLKNPPSDQDIADIHNNFEYIFYDSIPQHCYKKLTLGVTYLIYAKQDPNTSLITTNSCGRTSPILSADKDIEELNKITIHGKVIY